MYYLVLQVCYYLMVGQVKSVKPVLKQLQQSIQTITAPDWPSDADMVNSKESDQFIWMAKEHLGVLVYLVTVMHSMQVTSPVISSPELTQNLREGSWRRRRGTRTRP